MACNCKKKFIAEVTVNYSGVTRPETFLKYACVTSGKIYYYNKATLEQVDFAGRAGEELVVND